MSRFIPRLIAGFLFSLACVDAALAADSAPRDNGYRGIWFTLGQMGEHGDKYSGGLGTYTANHRPLAVHAPAAGKTFFVYGGAKEGRRHFLIMASYYDHERDVVPRPVIVHDKQGVDDPHDNASIALDGDGHVWVFVSGRGQKRPGFKYRSLAPYSIDAFERVSEEEMTYPQPWWVPGAGFIHVFTKYTRGREIYWNTSGDGRAWSEARKLAGMGGHYQIAEPQPGGVASVFNYHPDGNVDRRTNIYYVQTLNMGATWTTVDGQPIDTPLEATANPALVRDYENEGRLVYLCDLAFDEARRPVVLYVTSGHHMPGPEGDTPVSRVARWDGTAWRPLGAGVNGTVLTLEQLTIGGRNLIVVGGNFTEAGGQTVNRIAAWDQQLGTWQPLGSGANDRVMCLASALTSEGPRLYAGGLFTSIGGIEASRFAIWDGSAWTEAEGLGLPSGAMAMQAVTDETTVSVMVGGTFASGPSGTSHLAEWRACLQVCEADLNEDGGVNSADLALLLSTWGSASAADLNADGIVNSSDLGILLGNWGSCG